MTKTPCVPNIVGTWIRALEKLFIGDKDPLKTDSYLVCLNGGGIIRFTDSGQTVGMATSAPAASPSGMPALTELVNVSRARASRSAGTRAYLINREDGQDILCAMPRAGGTNGS
jgi:hypothetical protein